MTPVDDAGATHAVDRLAPDAAGEPIRSVRAVLADYWGREWPRIEQELAKQGLDLDASFELRPWSDVAEDFRSLFVLSDSFIEASRSRRIGWPLELTADWVLQEYPVVGLDARAVGPREVAELDYLCADINGRLYESFETWRGTMTGAMDECWREGAFVKAPFSTHGVRPLKEGRAFYAGSRSGNSWSVRLQLFHDDYPGIEELNFAMARLRLEREILVKEYLKSLL